MIKNGIQVIGDYDNIKSFAKLLDDYGMQAEKECRVYYRLC